MKKGIAIQTILLLLVGVIVAGVLVYLVYSYATTSGVSIQQCKSELVTVCNLCKMSNWNLAVNVDSDLTTKCGKLPELSHWSGVDDCNEGGTTEQNCGLLGIK